MISCCLSAVRTGLGLYCLALLIRASGTEFMNRCDYVDPSLCWIGCKDTDRGGALSVIGYQILTRPKSYDLKKA